MRQPGTKQRRFKERNPKKNSKLLNQKNQKKWIRDNKKSSREKDNCMAIPEKREGGGM